MYQASGKTASYQSACSLEKAGRQAGKEGAAWAPPHPQSRAGGLCGQRRLIPLWDNPLVRWTRRPTQGETPPTPPSSVLIHSAAVPVPSRSLFPLHVLSTCLPLSLLHVPAHGTVFEPPLGFCPVRPEPEVASHAAHVCATLHTPVWVAGGLTPWPGHLAYTQGCCLPPCVGTGPQTRLHSGDSDRPWV